MNMAALRIIEPAKRVFRGRVTNPERWSTWQPRSGDVIVCAPMKCGTTWTQTIIAMLLAGSTELPDKVSVISPWVDSRLGDADEVRRALSNQDGRRVVKTHTPADGFPIWEGIMVIAIYRHPLDVFLSSRAHAANRHEKADPRMLRPVAEALRSYLNEPLNTEAWDDNTLETLVEHYRQTVMSCRSKNLTLLHYADLIFDHRSSVKRLATAIGVAVDDIQVDRIVAATKISAMRAGAEQFVPEAGKKFWTSEKDFFGSGGTEKWCGKFLQEDLDIYLRRLAELVPETAPRDWLEHGYGYP